MVCAFSTIVWNSLFRKPDENLKNSKSIMSLQRAFVFLNYWKYTAGLHVAVSSLKNFQEEGACLLSSFSFMRNGAAVRFGVTLVPGVGFSQCHPKVKRTTGCLPPCHEPLIHFSTHKWAVGLNVFFLCLANACSATIIWAQVGWLLFQALSRLYCPKGYSLSA